MERSSRWGLGALACAVAFVLAVGVAMHAETASAAGQCNTFNINGWFAGAEASGGNPYGVRARIEGRTPALCTGGLLGSTFSSSWVGLLGNDPGDGWAQVGYERYKKQNGQFATKKFAQWIKCLNFTQCRPHTKRKYNVGALERYTVVYNFNTHKMQMVAGRRRMLTTTFDPYAVWGTPLSTHLKTETRYCETDTIGTVSNAAEYSSIQTRKSDHAWGPPPLDIFLLAQCTQRYQKQWGHQPDLFYVWTDPL